MPTFIKSSQDIQQIESFFRKDWKTTKNIQQRYNVHKLSLNNQRKAAEEAHKKRAFSEKLEQLEKWHKLLANDTTKQILIREAQQYQKLDNTSIFTTQEPSITHDAHVREIMRELLETTPQNPPQHSRDAQQFDLLPNKLDIPQHKPPRERRLIRLRQPHALPAEETTRRLMTPLSKPANKLPLLANPHEPTKSRLQKLRPTPLLSMQQKLEKENKTWEQALKKSPRR